MSQHRVDGDVRLGDGINPRLAGGLDAALVEGSEGLDGGVEAGLDSVEDVGHAGHTIGISVTSVKTTTTVIGAPRRA